MWGQRTEGVRLFLGAAFCVVLSLAGVVATEAQAQEYQRSVKPLVVKNDRGGVVRKRVLEISRLRRSGRQVRITGAVCMSSCTMYLGLPQTCVSPRTTFGFHGPSSYGRSLDPEEFEKASRIISRHYPPALRQWYMQTGRYKIRTFYRMRGAQLIKLGVQEC